MGKDLFVPLMDADKDSGTGTDSSENAEETSTEAEGKKEATKVNEAKYTDEDLDHIIGKKFAKWQAEKDKEIEEAKKLAGMSAEEKAKAEKQKAEAERDDYKAKLSFFEMSKVARAMLSEASIAVSDDMIASLVTSEAETTKVNIEAFVTAFNAEVDKQVAERLKGSPPPAGKGKSSVTKKEILGIKDPVERQKKIKENMDLFD